jgi:hypothetical protein
MIERFLDVRRTEKVILESSEVSDNDLRSWGCSDEEDSFGVVAGIVSEYRSTIERYRRDLIFGCRSVGR